MITPSLQQWILSKYIYMSASFIFAFLFRVRCYFRGTYICFLQIPAHEVDYSLLSP